MSRATGINSANSARPASAAPSIPWRADPLLIFVILLTLTSVWRLQQTIPVLGVLQLPSIAAVGSYALYLAQRDRRRGILSIKSPVTWGVLGMLLCVAISAPLGEYFGQTFQFLTKDYIKTVAMFGLVAACVRSRRDLELLIGSQIIGALFYSTVVLRTFKIEESSGRLGSLYYYDSNDLAMILAMTLPLTVYFLRPRAGTAAYRSNR